MRRAVQIVGPFLALLIWLPALSLADLVFGLIPTSEADAIAVGDVGYGIAVGALVGVPLASQVHAPERKIAPLQQIPLVALALAFAAAATGEPIGVLGGAILLVPLLIVLALHPRRRDVFRRPRSASGRLLGLAVVAAAPAVAYVWTTAADERAGRLPESSYSVIPSLGAAASGAALATVLVALLAALRPQGWFVTAASAGAAAFLLGLVFVVNAAAPASAGRWWGAATVAWALAWIASSVRERRRETADAPTAAPP